MEEIDIEVAANTAANAVTTTTTNINTTVDPSTNALPNEISTTISPETSNKNINNFIVRMNVHPYNFYPYSKIKPVLYTKQIPQPHRPLYSLSLLLDVVMQEEEKTGEQKIKEEEWKSIWQHFNDFIQHDKKVIAQKRIVRDRFFFMAMVFLVVLFFPENLEEYELAITSILQGFFITRACYFIMFVVQTYVMYSHFDEIGSNVGDIPNSNEETNRRQAHYNHQSIVTTNQFLLVVANIYHSISTVPSISCITEPMPFLAPLGFWVVVSWIMFQIHIHELSGWYYIIIFVVPILSVSIYVLYHIGSCTQLYVSGRNRYLYYISQHDNALKRVYFEVKRYNNVLTYFTLQPKINYDFAHIVVDVYSKNADSNTETFEKSGVSLPTQSMNMLSPSSSSNLGVTKRRGGGGDCEDTGGFITVIEQCSYQQQQQQRTENRLFYDDDKDGLATPLLMKDTTM